MEDISLAYSLFPMYEKNLLAIFAECELQFSNSFIVKPRKLKHETCSIFLSLIINDNDNDNDNESNFIAMNYIDHIIGDVQASY